MERILVVSPHTDDGELGCGGFVSRLISEGKEVFYVAFSAAEKSVPKDFPSDTLRKEVYEATAVLGIKRENVSVLKYDVRVFSDHRQEILDDLLRLKREIKPDTVFVPSTYDLHQDHKTTTEESMRAFKDITLLGYELPWNNISFRTSFFARLGEEDVRTKIDALAAYKTQEGRDYFKAEYITALAITRGTQIKTRYAETYEIIRYIA